MFEAKKHCIGGFKQCFFRLNIAWREKTLFGVGKTMFGGFKQ